MEYFNRYNYFTTENNHKIVPNVEIPFKATDKYITFKKNVDRLDKISQEFYGSPLFGWLILMSNPTVSSFEFDIPNDTILRIPYPLITTLQDYKKSVENYKKYYGE